MSSPPQISAFDWQNLQHQQQQHLLEDTKPSPSSLDLQQIQYNLQDNREESTPSLSLHQTASSISQILNRIVSQPIQSSNQLSSMNKELSLQKAAAKPAGIFLKYSDLLALNEVAEKLNEVVTRLNEAYDSQASTSQTPPSSLTSPYIPDNVSPYIIEDAETMAIQSHETVKLETPFLATPENAEESPLDPLLNITHGISSFLKPCLIVSKDDKNVYEYTLQKKRCGNEYYACSYCRKLPSPRSNLVIYFDGKITCSPHNAECIPTLKEENVKKQQKRQRRLKLEQKYTD